MLSINRSVLFGIVILFGLTACGGGGGGGGSTSNGPIDTSVPSQVNFVTATPGDGEVIVRWSNVSGSSYNIYWSTTINTASNGTLIENVNLSPFNNVAAGYKHAGLNNGTTYFYVVTEINSLGESIVSDETRATPSDSILLSNLTFADANLAQCIADKATIFNYSFVYEILSLDCDFRNISDISGIEALTSLEELNLNDNGSTMVGMGLTDLSPLMGMSSLAVIEVSDFGILGGIIPPDLSPLAGMINLLEVHASNYLVGVSDFSVLSNLVNLRKVGARNNNVTNLNFLANLTYLENLDLADNRNISDYSLVFTLTKLEELFLGGIEVFGSTNLSDVSQISNLPNLRTLDLSSSAITNFSEISKLTNLTILNISNNQIANTSFLSPLVNLESLLVSNANISSLDITSTMPNLELLDISKNNISDISAISGMVNIRALFFDENNISDISVLATKTNINQLGLGNNTITDFSAVSNLNLLQVLRAENSGLDNIDFLIGLNELVRLRLQDNNISSVSNLAGFTKLRSLFLQNNNLGGLNVGNVDQLAGLISLTELFLMNNLNMSCSELDTLIIALGSPPVDTDNNESTVDVASNGVNCTNP